MTSLEKNLTARQITIAVTALITVSNIVVTLTLAYIFDIDINPFGLLSWIFVQLVTSYLILKRFLEKFVFRKIKLIYKFIHDSKLSSNSKLKQDHFEDKSIEDVNQEVVEWGVDKEKEIKSLKSLESYRRDYVGNISHELKTPIFSIQGYLHTLLDGAMKDKKLNKRYLKRAAENADRLQNIVDDLEIITRLEEGKEVLDMEIFNLRDLIREVIIDLKTLAKEKNNNLGFKIGADQSYSVIADKESIRQVLINLMVNAIKYGIENGQTKISMYDMDENILVEISDNGIGIVEEHHNHVFDRFYRADHSRSRDLGGSGLGLSIVKHIIEAHQQNINLRSTPGVGSTFGFTLKKAR